MDETTTERILMANKIYLFSWFDYILFFGMLGISIAIGIYFGFFGKKQSTEDEYLKGGKQMKVIPIAISLIASQISTATLVAVPADVYRFGSNYLWLAPATIIECAIAYYIYLPVFFNLQITSIYEYIQLRFDKKLRLLSSFLSVLSMLVYCPIVVYIPSLAFSQVTGVNVHLMAGVTSAICIFYTTVGGLKAVVWTDAVQFLIMIVAYLIIFFMGVSTTGGFGFMWKKSVEGGRLDILDFSFDPTLRDSFGALMIGGMTQWLAYTAVSQGSVQKMLAVPSYNEVKKIVPLYGFGVALFHVFAALTGLLLYARYWNCDPLLSNELSRFEQFVPHFVMDVARELPGLSGIFIAGVYSAGLSSLSANLNTLSAIIYKDFIAPFMSKKTSQKCISNILKGIVLIGGIISTLLVLIFEKLEGIFSVYTALMAVSIGPVLGIFSLGMLIPKSNSKGAFFGALLSSIVVALIAIQNQSYQSVILAEFIKPTSVDGCNSTTISVDIVSAVKNVQEDSPFILYRISFWYYSFIGFVLTMIIGVIVSCFTKHDKQHIPIELLSPVIHCFVKRNELVELSIIKSKIDEKQKTKEALLENQCNDIT